MGGAADSDIAYMTGGLIVPPYSPGMTNIQTFNPITRSSGGQFNNSINGASCHSNSIDEERKININRYNINYNNNIFVDHSGAGGA